MVHCPRAAPFWTYWVEVDVAIFQSEHLQILQSHVGSLLHRLQVLLAVGETHAAKQIGHCGD